MSEIRVIRGNTHSKNFQKKPSLNQESTLKAPGNHYSGSKTSSHPNNSLLNTLKQISQKNKETAKLLIPEFREEEKTSLVSTGVFVDHRARLSTNLPSMLDKQLTTEFQLPERVLDLRWEFPYGIDKEIQVQEDEIFIFENEVQSLVEVLKRRILEDSLMEVR